MVIHAGDSGRFCELWQIGDPTDERVSQRDGHSGKLNIVFGGGNSFSHGVRIKKGKARFVLVSLTIH